MNEDKPIGDLTGIWDSKPQTIEVIGNWDGTLECKTVKRLLELGYVARIQTHQDLLKLELEDEADQAPADAEKLALMGPAIWDYHTLSKGSPVVLVDGRINTLDISFIQAHYTKRA